MSDDTLLADLHRVAQMFGVRSVPMPKYRRYERFDDANLVKRFGTWSNALISAGLSISNEINISDDHLFENLLMLWQHYGRQRRSKELGEPP